MAKFSNTLSKSAFATVLADLSGIGTIHGNLEKQQIAVKMYFAPVTLPSTPSFRDTSRQVTKSNSIT
jgi:hypothetical protein